MKPDVQLRQSKKVIHCLQNYVGVGFHPDTYFEDYVDDNGEKVFTMSMSIHFNSMLDQAFKLFYTNDECIYEFCLANQKILILKSK